MQLRPRSISEGAVARLALQQRDVGVGLILLGILCGIAAPRAVVAEERVDYRQHVRPLLAERCTVCHGPLKQSAGLRLDAGVLIHRGGDSGAAVEPRNAEESLLIGVVTGEAGFTMPPEGKPLSDEEIALLKAWIEQGAVVPEDEEVIRDPREHWAFVAPVRPEVPQVENAGWVRNPIDAFLAAEHERLGLEVQAEAAKHVLLRRVSLDLIGLPPTPAELRDFLADDAPDAYEKAVKRLLESPHYGERWGRHWMDVWRYSDWYGFGQELRHSARHLWRWRDWIVESLNADKPYDEMVLEMLAADELAPTDDDALRATGFLARHYFKFNRNTWLEATVEHTGKAFLGLTLNCAKCHDHMYDPVSQREYYEFRAIFEPYEVRADRVPGEADPIQDGLSRAYDADRERPTFLFLRGNESEPDESNPLTAGIPAIFSAEPLGIAPVPLPPEAWYPGLRPHVRQEMLAAAETQVEARRSELDQAQESLAVARLALAEVREAHAAALAPAGTAPVEAPPPPFLVDDFRRLRPALWIAGPGAWHYRNGALHQEEVVAERRFFLSADWHPRDFRAIVRFRTTGGATWKSAGLSFDHADDSNHQGVYLSAYAGGPKVQVAVARDGSTTYPAEAARSLPIEIGRDYELQIDVRDRLLNVHVDGVLEIVHTLDQPRQDGRLALWTYDATAEFLSIRVEPLPVGARLAVDRDASPPTADPLAAAEVAVSDSESAALIAERRLAAAEAQRAALEAKLAADSAKYADPPAENSASLAEAAAAAERRAALLEARAALADAEHTRVRADRDRDARPDDAAAKQAVETARTQEDAARQQLESAQAAAEKTDAEYTPLTEVYPAVSSGRRLALAQWIASDQNPLTARVAVNHVWMRHFGEPLVPTVFDFGLNGQRPTHPELLDWLAVEFMRPSDMDGGSVGTGQARDTSSSGWRLKHLHRLIVTSSAYRMRSSLESADSENRRLDPDNRFLWRMNARRMESEAVRDSVLQVAGQLDRTMGGPELDADAGQTTSRRSLYYRHAPEKFMTFLKLFDAASVEECYRRDETIVPQQALALANSPLSVEQSRRLAARIGEEVGSGSDGATERAFIEAAFEQILCRPPTDDERRTCAEFLRAQTERLSDPESLTLFVDGPEAAVQPAGEPHLRARENLIHVLFNHNEFVTVR